MRYERRHREARRAARAREHFRNAIVVLLGVLLSIALMAIAEGGVSDAELRANEIAYWESQGVTIWEW